jgi:hypothetical protein
MTRRSPRSTKIAGQKTDWGHIAFCCGNILFITACCPLLVYGCAGESLQLQGIQNVQRSLHIAGWLITMGFLCQRWDARVWPFHSPRVVRIVRKTGKSILNFIGVLFATLAITAVIMLLMLARIHRLQ